MLERKYLGVVDVDSGTLLVGDPAYLLARKAAGVEGPDFQEVVDADRAPDGVQLGERLVLLIQGFGGDGTYAVFGEYEDGAFVRLIVEFDPTWAQRALAAE